MIVSIWISDLGLELIAIGIEPYYWNFVVRKEGDGQPTNALCIAEDIEINLPSRETAARIAVEILREKKQAIYAEAEKEAREVEERIQNMLALEGPSS